MKKRKVRCKLGRPAKVNRLVTMSADVSPEEREAISRWAVLNQTSMSATIRRAVVELLNKFGMLEKGE